MLVYFVFHSYCIAFNLSLIRACVKQDPIIISEMLKITDNIFMVSIRAGFFVIVLAPLTFLALAKRNQESIRFILNFIFKESK